MTYREAERKVVEPRSLADLASLVRGHGKLVCESHTLWSPRDKPRALFGEIVVPHLADYMGAFLSDTKRYVVVDETYKEGHNFKQFILSGTGITYWESYENAMYIGSKRVDGGEYATLQPLEQFREVLSHDTYQIFYEAFWPAWQEYKVDKGILSFEVKTLRKKNLYAAFAKQMSRFGAITPPVNCQWEVQDV